MNRKLNQFVSLLKEDLGLFLSISFGVFLFVLFFEPFDLDKLDFNNRLLFVAGLAAISFFLMSFVRIALPWLIQKYDQDNFVPILPAYMNSFIIYALAIVSFAIYLHYVGSVEISFYIVFKIGLICIALPVSLRLYDIIRELKLQNEALIKEKEIVLDKVEKYEEDYLNKSIEFISDSNTENLILLIADVAFIKSADNYVEIVFKEGADGLKSKLIRNTLKNIELQLKPYANFIRCHRVSIVNAYYVEKLNKDENNHWISIKGFDERIPVSRQYLLKLKETI
jgi:hypothetical protein